MSAMSDVQRQRVSKAEPPKARRVRAKPLVDDPMVRPRELVIMLGLDYSTIYRMFTATPCRFPRPIQLGKKAIGWRRSTVVEWIDSQQRREIAV